MYLILLKVATDEFEGEHVKLVALFPGLPHPILCSLVYVHNNTYGSKTVVKNEEGPGVFIMWAEARWKWGEEPTFKYVHTMLESKLSM